MATAIRDRKLDNIQLKLGPKPVVIRARNADAEYIAIYEKGVIAAHPVENIIVSVSDVEDGVDIIIPVSSV